jgi:bacillithiol system protein YtxJ
LDLLRHRDISDEIAKITGVLHQSPQVIVLKNKEVVYAATHSGISARAALQVI